MNMVIWIVLGGLIGWLASIVMGADAKQGVVLNVLIGVVGAFLAGISFAPVLGTGTVNHNDFSLPSLLVSFLGALVLLGIVNVVRRGSLR
jgi:uncharacterized membrane protein YeaQ/YmgE (transglycosylase-associated protein family)